MLSQPFVIRASALLLIACCPVVARAQMSSVNWRTNLDQAKVEAAHSGRLLLLHFTTARCGPCRLLDQQVFSQPQVGPAIEQDFIPVRIDADHSPALAQMYRIRNVPTEIIATAEGQALADPPIPDKADPYLAQLQNIARHFRQGPAAVQPTNVNAAYAALPVSQRAAPQVINNPAMQAAAASPPQAQMNPYVAANPRVDGQAQSVYAAAAPASPPQLAQQTAAQPAPTQQAAAPPATSQTAAAAPAIPTNAMPRSYRNPALDATTPASASAAAPVAAAAAGALAASAAPAAGAAPGLAASGPAASSASPAITVAAASGAALAAAAPRPAIELPAGSPPLAFDGYCPVSLKTLNRWTAGDRQFGAIHRGRTYLFAGAEQRDQFLANPDGFSPVFAGLDPVLLIDKQQSVEGSRALGYRYGDAFYLFSCEESKQKFAASPHRYAAGVRQAMSRVDADGPVRR